MLDIGLLDLACLYRSGVTSPSSDVIMAVTSSDVMQGSYQSRRGCSHTARDCRTIDDGLGDGLTNSTSSGVVAADLYYQLSTTTDQLPYSYSTPFLPTSAGAD